MKLLNNFKQGLIHGIGILTILGLAGITYAAFNFNDTITEVSSNGTLLSAEYNKLVKKLNMINEKQLATAWVNFDGTDCTGGVGVNECSIRDNYNINKVVRIATGEYDIYFGKPMLNNDYSLGHTTWGNNGLWTYEPWYGLNKVHISTKDNGVKKDDYNVNLQVYGGK